MIANDTATATEWVAIVCQRAGQRREPAPKQGRERRLTDPAQGKGGERDAELGGGDGAAEIVDGAPRYRCAPAPRLGHFIEPGPAGADKGELRGDEERIGRDEGNDRGQTEEGTVGVAGFHTARNLSPE